MDRIDILKQATNLTTNDRQKSYGTPYRNHARIARFWSDYLGFEVSSEQVAICMVLLKVARLMEQSGSEAIDTFVDLTAYAAISGELAIIEESRRKLEKNSLKKRTK